MHEQEGIIKFELRFTPAPPLARPLLAELNGWRTIFYRLGLIGRDPHRYGGVGFGNMSMRLETDARRFAVTGSQTGGIEMLDEAHYSIVTECDPVSNRLTAVGPIAPSSESLTHGQIYALDRRVNFVFHVHSLELWRAAARLQIPATAASAAYGTPEMAREVERLFNKTESRSGIFAMGGHKDGIVSYGATAAAAGAVLLRYAALALGTAASR